MPNYNFTINGHPLEVVKEYKYLGVLFSRSGSFLAMKNTLPIKLKKLCLSRKESKITIITYRHTVGII